MFFEVATNFFVLSLHMLEILLPRIKVMFVLARVEATIAVIRKYSLSMSVIKKKSPTTYNF